MREIRTLSWVAALALFASAVLVAGPAQATPISAGSSLIYNFDFTSQTPPPPYTNQMAIRFSYSSISAPADYLVFRDLNGTGGTADSFGFGSHFVLGGLTQPSLLDGVFSVRVTALTDLDITIARAFAANQGDTVFNISVDGVLEPTSVPEPSSLALFAAGLVVFGAARRLT